MASVRDTATQAITRRGEPVRFQLSGLLACNRAEGPMGEAYKLRDDENVPLICPTCQNVFCGVSTHASDPFVCKGFLSLHGVVFDILVGREDRTGRTAAKRGLPSRRPADAWQDSNLQPDSPKRPAPTIELQAAASSRFNPPKHRRIPPLCAISRSRRQPVCRIRPASSVSGCRRPRRAAPPVWDPSRLRRSPC
jgi:hypothetical protein